jgi:hypothetical protein
MQIIEAGKNVGRIASNKTYGNTFVGVNDIAEGSPFTPIHDVENAVGILDKTVRCDNIGMDKA